MPAGRHRRLAGHRACSLPGARLPVLGRRPRVLPGLRPAQPGPGQRHRSQPGAAMGTGPSGRRACGGRSWPQRAQAAVAPGAHEGQTGWPVATAGNSPRTGPGPRRSSGPGSASARCLTPADQHGLAPSTCCGRKPGARGARGTGRQPGQRHTPTLKRRCRRTPGSLPRQPANPVNDQGQAIHALPEIRGQRSQSTVTFVSPRLFAGVRIWPMSLPAFDEPSGGRQSSFTTRSLSRSAGVCERHY